MGEADWSSVRIKSELRSQIERAIETIKIRNVPKYDSIADFVQDAVVVLLDKEGVNSK